MPETDLSRSERWALATFVRRFPQVHLGIGLLGNAIFVAGTLLYLTKHSTPGLYCFLVGSSGMFLGTLGEFLRVLGRHRLARFDVDPGYPDRRWSVERSDSSSMP